MAVADDYTLFRLPVSETKPEMPESFIIDYQIKY
jgi:hypothetical protein